MNMYLKCLAREEPEIVSMAVKPGIVDTEIVQGLYSDPKCAETMDPEQFKFMKLQRDNGKLLKPQLPAEVMAKLILEAPKSLSGKFFDWNDPKLNLNWK